MKYLILIWISIAMIATTTTHASRLSNPRLSADGRRSCTTCHQSARGFAGATAPSLLDLAERRSVGRGQLSLEAFVEQALRTELGATPAQIEARLGVPWEIVVSDLGAEIRELRSAPVPLSAQAQRGAVVFAAAGCANCHAGPTLGGDAIVAGGPTQAAPRRVPALHTAALSAPYFADGSAATLDEVIAVYERGGRDGAGQALAPLLLSDADRADLLAFLSEQRAEVIK